MGTVMRVELVSMVVLVGATAGCGGSLTPSSLELTPDGYRSEDELPLEGRAMHVQGADTCAGLSLAEARRAATQRQPHVYAFDDRPPLEVPACSGVCQPGPPQHVWVELQQDLRVATCYESKVLLRGMVRIAGFDVITRRPVSVLAGAQRRTPDLRLPVHIACAREEGQTVRCEARGVGSERNLTDPRQQEVFGAGTFDLYARPEVYVSLSFLGLSASGVEVVVPLARSCGVPLDTELCRTR